MPAESLKSGVLLQDSIEWKTRLDSNLFILLKVEALYSERQVKPIRINIVIIVPTRNLIPIIVAQ